MKGLSFAFVFFFSVLSVVSSAMSAKKLKILVFGGTGFVGSTFIAKAAERGHQIVAVSRRTPSTPVPPNVKYVSTNAVNADGLQKALAKEKDFDACIHAIGLLFDSESNLSKYNVIMSGSGSVPDSDATYDKITRQTALNALSIFNSKKTSSTGSPFVFVSAAEAGWTFESPVQFLEKYLIAKRAVEKKLLDSTPAIRPVIFRPSLIWTMKKPVSLFSVIPFFIGNAIGLSFVDRPVTVEALTDAMLTAVESGSVSGIQRFPEIDELSKRALSSPNVEL